MLRCSRDFDTVDDYTGFLGKVVDRRNRLVKEKLEQELPHLQCLPPSSGAGVRQLPGPGAQVEHHPGSRPDLHRAFPTRREGTVQIRLYAEHLEVYYKGHLVERMERVRGEREARVDYRHIIGSLVRKPGAFARYRFREQMFPSMTFRLAYDALKRWRGERADVEYVRILHLAATTMESTVDSTLALLLEAGDPFDYAAVKDLANPTPPLAPGAEPARAAGPEGLRQLAGGGGLMTDTVAINDRIGELCRQFRLPTMGAQSVARFTAAGHGDALSTFLEVLEQEGEDRRQRRIGRLRTSSRLPAGKTWETPVFTGAGSSSMTGCR